ncbi:hypothetical protein SULI_12500 [Saccharolobus solfataricus]|uniref:SWIM-type domain-containing protein n=3 Tax=Saccharolobus solfataricus TaxID=2287 RepID=Q97XQ4_SACS2|nr:SWIM zinc finger family protein [Saccharolobus solfataricus]AAK41869.1 Hypothetical protein SSO1656 [Saccharolobus solfataricus P2]AKA74602.1 hypothetical protein SULB_2466 [Saccharolobus solfataricus]AKA77298.1 hypothetical protein SULC_2463 [Saccharolobus solfataricus]AKA79989.1 hypothetical protein SULA_2465 [Saccharolobus solfataricus]AZF69070.1 hypothetical protein SULG_12500 [Saccharolobus solfataricus]
MKRGWLFDFGKNIREEIDDGRASRGREYVRNGAVRKIEINPGKIAAQVSGTKLYDVNIYGNTLSEEDKRKVINIINKKGYLSSLLSYKFPTSIIDDLDEEGIELIPRNLSYECTCPDYQRPCKHIYAVYLTAYDIISNNPLLLFKFLGINKEELIYEKGQKIMQEISVKDFQRKYEFPSIKFVNAKPWNKFGNDKEVVKHMYMLIMKTAERKIDELK